MTAPLSWKCRCRVTAGWPSILVLALMSAGCKDKPSPAPTGSTTTSTPGSTTSPHSATKPSTAQVAATTPRALVARGPHVPSTEIAMQVQQVEFTFPSEKFLDEVKQPQFFERYRGRMIEITGKVGRVAKDDQGPFVTLQAGDDDTRLRCYTISKAPGARVGRGMPIRIRGQVPADDRAPLKDCLFMEVSPGLAVAVPAVKLAKEFAADFAAAKAK